MRRVTQALGKPDNVRWRWSSVMPALALAGLLSVSGCGSKGFSINDAVPDRALITGSVSRDARAGRDATAQSDEVTIRNAVSSAEVEDASVSDQSWANAATGSRGTIRSIVEERDTGRLCREFEATRESYEGIHLYRGRTCANGSGDWTITSYNRVE